MSHNENCEYSGSGGARRERRPLSSRACLIEGVFRAWPMMPLCRKPNIFKDTGLFLHGCHFHCHLLLAHMKRTLLGTVTTCTTITSHPAFKFRRWLLTVWRRRWRWRSISCQRNLKLWRILFETSVNFVSCTMNHSLTNITVHRRLCHCSTTFRYLWRVSNSNRKCLPCRESQTL